MHRCLALVILLFIFLFCQDNERGQYSMIVNGRPITIQEAPYQLSIEKITEGNQLFHMCGATIIGKTWALSAAHCNLEADGSYTLRAGTQFVDQGGSVHKIAEVIESPDWNQLTYDSDFALLKVEPPFEYDETTRRVKLPPLGEDGYKVGDMAFVSGWGYTQPTVETASQVLQATDVPIVSLQDCFKYMGKMITEKMLCAGYPEGGPDACKGDSGGPLVLDGVLIGVVSWGKGCAQKGKVGVYSKIAVKRAWITEVSGI